MNGHSVYYYGVELLHLGGLCEIKKNTSNKGELNAQICTLENNGPMTNWSV